MAEGRDWMISSGVGKSERTIYSDCRSVSLSTQFRRASVARVSGINGLSSAAFPPCFRRSAVALSHEVPQTDMTPPELTSATRLPALGADLLVSCHLCRDAQYRSRECGSLGSQVQSNRLVWGGARHGGSRENSATTLLLSRWLRICSMITAFSMQAMIRTAPRKSGISRCQ